MHLTIGSRRNRRIVAGLVALLAAVAVAAFGARSQRASASSLAHASSQTLTVGIALDPPWTLQSPSGGLISFNPALLQLLAGYLHEKVQLVTAGWTGIVAGLQTGKYQMIGADLNATAERRKVIDFTIPYFYSGTTWFVNANSPYKTLTDLNKPSVTIAFVGGSDTESATRNTLPKAQYRSLPNATSGDLISEVAAGHSTAFANSNYLGGALTTKYHYRAIPSLTTTPNGIAPVGIAWAVQKGNSSLLAKLNAFLRQETANGTIAKLRTKYLTAKGFAQSVGLK